jgi:hypothetical protein
MAWSRRRFAVLAWVIGGLTLAIGIGVATGAKLKTRSQTETLDTGLGTATASCKQGEKVVSGGFTTPDFNVDLTLGARITAYESYKGGRREWTVSARNDTATEGTLTAYAYCRKGKGTRTKSESVEVAPFPAEGSATASCGKGRKVVSGGSMSPGYDYKGFSGSVHPYESRKQGPRKWVASGNNRSSLAGTLIAYAYCRKGKGLKTVSESTQIQTDAAGTATARCKRGHRVVSGGFDVPDFDTFGPVVRVYESRKVGRRKWRASAIGFFAPGTLTAYAYCEKKKVK